MFAYCVVYKKLPEPLLSIFFVDKNRLTDSRGTFTALYCISFGLWWLRNRVVAQVSDMWVIAWKNIQGAQAKQKRHYNHKSSISKLNVGWWCTFLELFKGKHGSSAGHILGHTKILALSDVQVVVVLFFLACLDAEELCLVHTLLRHLTVARSNMIQAHKQCPIIIWLIY